MNTSPHYDEPETLFNEFLDGTLDETQAATLLEWIKTDTNNLRSFQLNVLSDYLIRRFYEPYDEQMISEDHADDTLTIDQLITRSNASEPGFGTQQAEPSLPLARRVLLFTKKCVWPDKTQKEESIAPVVTIISLFLLTIVGIFAFCDCFLVERDEEDEFPAVARIREMIDPVWDKNSTVYNRGQFLDSGQFELQSGWVQIEFKHGAHLVVEGPANFTVNGLNDLFCLNGKISGTISKEAIGYTIRTPLGTITDRGTEFFLDVSKEKIKVDVVRGKVDYLSPTRELLCMVAGNTLDFDLSRRAANLIPAPSFPVKQFVTLPDFRHRARAKAETILQKKKERDLELDLNPNLLARFDFANREDAVVPNTSSQGAAIYPRLRLYNSRLTEGSMADTHAALFGKGNSRAELVSSNTNQAWSGLFLSAYIRIDQLKSNSMIIFSSGSDPSNPNSFYWQIAPNGELGVYFGQGQGKNPAPYCAQSKISKKDVGTWIKIGVKIDSKMKKISHYVNDQVIGTNNWPNPVPLHLDKANIGNTDPGGKQIKKGFHGAMEEFQISIF